MSPAGDDECPMNMENAWQIVRRRESKPRRGRRKNRAGGACTLKDVKNEGRSGNVYENKGPDDNLPDTKDDICAGLHALLHKNTRIYPETHVFCRSPGFFYRISSVGEPTPRFNTEKVMAWAGRRFRVGLRYKSELLEQPLR